MKRRVTLLTVVAIAVVLVACSDDDDSASAPDVSVPLPVLTVTVDGEASDDDRTALVEQIRADDDVQTLGHESGTLVYTITLDDTDEDVDKVVERFGRFDHVAKVAPVPVQALFVATDNPFPGDRAAFLRTVEAFEGVDRVEDVGGGVEVYLTPEDQALFELIPELAALDGVANVSVASPK